MVQKLLPNRSSKTVAPNALAKIRQAAQLIYEVLGDETPMSDAEYKGLRKIADKLKQESDDVLNIMKENPDLIEAPLSVTEMEKDKNFYELCDQIRSIFTAILIRLEREQNIAGAEYYNSCSIFESDVAVKVKRGNAHAQNVQTELKRINRNRTNSPKKARKS